MRAKTIAAAIASAAIIVLCLPTGSLAHFRSIQVAGSKAPTRRGSGKKTLVRQEFSLRGSNGYAIKVNLTNRRKLEVEATVVDLKHTRVASIAYVLNVPPQADSNEIKARIGSLGRIDLRFVPRKTERGKSICEGGELTTETGHYVGSFSFNGDDGFTRVHSRRVAGKVEREVIRSCPLPKIVESDPKTEREEAETDELQLTALIDGGKVAFSATRLQPKSRKEPMGTGFIVLAKRQRGRVREGVFLGQFGEKAAALEATDPLHPESGAIVTGASPPFSGSATFRRESTGSAWSGDLTVYMPGFGRVPLAGPGAKATLCTSGCSGGPVSLTGPAGSTIR